jgi:SAM-dependent methyltransferase
VFKSFGVNKRENAQCETCGSLERHRLLWLYLHEKTTLFNCIESKKLLHFAPEKIFYQRFSELQNVEYFPCDLNEDKFKGYKGKAVVCADMTEIPYVDNSFDFIICNHVLEHIPDDGLAMRELRRVLKSSGWAILQVPIDYSLETTYEDFSINTPEGRAKAFGRYDHVRWYGRDYKSKLEDQGFKVVEDPFVKKFSKEELYKYGMFANEMVYFCQK